MENIWKYLSGAVMALAALLSPVTPLVACAGLFVAVDFVTGIMADRRRTIAAGEPWGFESHKAWQTVRKLCFVMAGIVLAWLIDAVVADIRPLNLAKMFTGFVCGVEFWSYLENAAQICDNRLFRRFRQLMKIRYFDRTDGESGNTQL